MADYDQDCGGLDSGRSSEDREWTPARGLIRGAFWGLLAAFGLALALAPLARFAPFMVLILWLRIPLGFAVTWLLCLAVQRAAGMTAPLCLALGWVLAAGVLVSNHAVFAVYGLPTIGGFGDWWAFPMSMVEQIIGANGDMLLGWGWCHPYVLLLLNGIPVLIGGAFGAALAARG